MIDVRAISKRFGAMPALENVSLTVRPGTVHGILGENGAGKSTLMNILFGLVRPDSGEIFLDGRKVVIGSPRAAQGLGIGMVHQHFKLVGRMTVADNIALSVGRGVGLVGRAALLARLRGHAESLKWSIDPAARVDRLSVGEQQRLEIIKALATGGRVLILDEPTAVLTPQEAEELLPALRRLASQGTAVLFISHKLNEVRKVCDDVTILRRGKLVISCPAGDLTREQMAEKMVGSRVNLPEVQSRDKPLGEVLLEVQSLSVIPRRGPAKLKDVSMAVRAGEIVGIAGVDGNGQGTLANVLLGTIKPSAGAVRFGQQDAAGKSIRWRLASTAYIPEDRQRDALVLPLSVQSNIMMKAYGDRRFSKWGWIHAGAWREHAVELCRRFDVRSAGVQESVGSLSGGNQQKVVLARELSGSPRVVIAVNPTRGLDIGATAFVMQQLLDARAMGAAVLLIHSDLDELLAISDRVLVMFEGQIHESGWPRQGRDRIGQLMLGAA